MSSKSKINKADFFASVKHIHFIGINGISMKALAEYTHIMYPSIIVTGNTNVPNYKIDNIVINEDINNFINKIDVCVYTSSISNNHIELAIIKQHPKILILKRSEYLNILTNDKERICVLGCHGKTSITTYIYQLLSPLNPTIFVGANLHNNKSFAIGTGPYVVENDESEEGFLNLPSNYTVIPNLNDDHLENYNNSFDCLKQKILKYFDFVKETHKSPYVIYCKSPDQQDLHQLILKSKLKNITYGIKNCDVNINITNAHDEFRCKWQWALTTKLESLKILDGQIFTIDILGKWNIFNITAAITVAALHNITINDIQLGIQQLYKPQRRLELIYNKNNTLVFDDYTVHPTEVKVVIEACLQKYGKNIYFIWQPHRLSRLKRLHSKFKEVFSVVNTNNIFYTPLYEVDITNYSENEWRSLIDYGNFIPYEELNTTLAKLEGKTIILLNAGDLSKLVRSFYKV